MADPARYDIDPMLKHKGNSDVDKVSVIADLYIERSESGKWIKYTDFKDYKAAQRRNATLEAITRLGVEVAELRAENERLRKAGDELALCHCAPACKQYISECLNDWLAAKGVQS